jgi:hypothetical protein
LLHYNLTLTCVLEEINPCDALPCLNGATCQIVSDVGYTIEKKIYRPVEIYDFYLFL